MCLGTSASGGFHLRCGYCHFLWVVMDLWSAVAHGVFGAGSGFMGLGAVIAFYGD